MGKSGRCEHETGQNFQLTLVEKEKLHCVLVLTFLPDLRPLGDFKSLSGRSDTEPHYSRKGKKRKSP